LKIRDLPTLGCRPAQTSWTRLHDDRCGDLRTDSDITAFYPDDDREVRELPPDLHDLAGKIPRSSNLRFRRAPRTIATRTVSPSSQSSSVQALRPRHRPIRPGGVGRRPCRRRDGRWYRRRCRARACRLPGLLRPPRCRAPRLRSTEERGVSGPPVMQPSFLSRSAGQRHLAPAPGILP